MKVGVMLNPPLHLIDNYKKDKVCEVEKVRIARQILEKLLMGITNKVERGQQTKRG
jgi:hypothetical protein